MAPGRRATAPGLKLLDAIRAARRAADRADGADLLRRDRLSAGLGDLSVSLFSIYTPTLQGPLGRPRQLRRAAGRRRVLERALGQPSSGPSARSSCRSCSASALALLLHQNIVFRSLARSLILFPYFMSTVVAVLVWRWLFNDLYGILNHLLMWTGLLDDAARLARPDAQRHDQRHPGRRLEVLPLRRDRRAGPPADHPRPSLRGRHHRRRRRLVGRFFDITLPQLRDVLFIVILLRAIWDFKEFDLIYLLTGGGPVTATQTLPLLVYKQAFALNEMGMRLGLRRG